MKVAIYTDSRLVANQIPGNFVSKEDSISAYMEMARNIL